MTLCPLLDVFLILRDRNLDLGPLEYIDAVNVLIAGHVSSRDELIWTLQALWGKSLDDQLAIETLLNQALPSRITPDQLAMLTREAQKQTAPSELESKSELQSEPSNSLRSPAEDRSSPPEAPLQGQAVEEHVEFSPLERPTETRPVTAPADDMPVLNFPFDLRGEVPGVRRNMRRSWKYFRRMGRSGAAEVLDVAATVERIQRDGVLVTPVMVPRRRNLSRVLVGVDRGGSMVAFEEWTDTLINAGLQSGVSSFEQFYFRNAPGEIVFQDPLLCKPVKFDELQSELEDFAVLIVSDAGAARGAFCRQRLRQTQQFLQRITAGYCRLAWLNPVPQTRWHGTTAEFVAMEPNLSMFPMDRRGIDAAMFVLRGRVKS